MAGVPLLMVEKAEAEKEERSLIETLLQGIEKSEQIAREATKQAFMEPGQPVKLQPFTEILQGKRSKGESKYTSEEFRRDIYEKLGVDQPERVEEDWGTIGKVSADILTDTLFNVDNLIFGLPGKLVGGTGELAKDALKAFDITSDSKALKALSKVDPSTLSRVTTGAVLGSVMAQEDDDALDVLKKMAIGAAAGAIVSPAATEGMTKIYRALDNHTVDSINQSFRPEFYKASQKLLSDIPVEERLGIKSDVGVQDISRIASKSEKATLERAHFYRKELEEIEKGLDEYDLAVYDNLRIQAAGMTKATREKYYKALKKKFTANGNKLRGPEKNALLNQASKNANSVVGKKMLPIIQEMDPSGKVVKAMDDFVKFNRTKIDQYNKTIKETGNPYLVGFDYYMPSILPDLSEVPKGLKRVRGGFKKVKTVTDPDLSALSRGEVRDLAAKNYAKAFMDNQERTARMLMTSLDNTPLDMMGGKFINGAIDTFDNLNRNIVAGQLFGHTTWVTTNYVDNLARAYMVAGVGPAVKAAVGGGWGLVTSTARVAVENKAAQNIRNVIKDIPLIGKPMEAAARSLEKLSHTNLLGEILDATHPKSTGKGKYDSDMLELATIAGVVDTDRARQFLRHWDQYGGVRTLLKKEEALPPLLRGLDEAIEKTTGATADLALKTARKGGQAVNATTKAIMNFLTDTVARVGSSNEIYTRVKTFEHVYKSLLKEMPGAYKEVKKIGFANAYQQGLYRGSAQRAAQIVEDTFFDYSKVTAFEKKYAKRLLPYWTFYTRNAHFWLKALTDPKTVSKVMQNLRVLKDIGREPTERERRYISKFQLAEGARMLPKSPDGRQVVVSIPSASVLEAINDVGGLAAVFGKLTGTWPEGISADRTKVAEKVSPIFKTAFELLSGKNLMTGQPTYPSDSPDKRARVFSDAFATKALFEYLPPLSFIPYKTKIYIDHKGKSYFIEDDTDARMIVVRRNLLPTRILDTIMGIGQDIKTKKRTPLEAGIHYFTPLSVRAFTPEQQVEKVKRSISRDKARRTKKRKSKEVKLGDEKGGDNLTPKEEESGVETSAAIHRDAGDWKIRDYLYDALSSDQNEREWEKEQGWRYKNDPPEDQQELQRVHDESFDEIGMGYDWHPYDEERNKDSPGYYEGPEEK